MRDIQLAEELPPNEEDRKEIIYPRNRRINMLKETYLNVYAPYEIIEVDGEKFIAAASCNEVFNKEDYKKGDANILLECVNKHSHQVSPFQVDNLFLEAYKIDLNDVQSILNFCNRYGVLGDLSQKNMFNPEFLDFMDSWGAFENLEFFKKEIEEFQECFDLYIMSEIDDEKELRIRWKERLRKDIEEMKKSLLKMKSDKALDNHPEAYYTALKVFEVEKKREEYQSKYPPLKKEILKEVKETLMTKINDRLPNVFSTLKMSPSGDLVEGITSYNLLGAVYYQLYQHIVKGSTFQECKYCGNYFGPLRKSDMSFCPNEPGDTSNRSRHENSYNAMVKRARKWAEEGLTPEEIQQKIKKPKRRSLEEIRSWIETGQKHSNKK